MEGVEAQKSRLVARNTVEYWRANGDRVIRYHHTDIVTFKTDGRVILDSGGWRTVTTKGRMDDYLCALGWRLFQHNGVWYLQWEETRFVFADGVTITGSGQVTGAAEAVDPKLPRRIAAYARAYVKALFAGDVPAPSNGDCWHCLMRTKEGNTLGEAFKDQDHITSHMDEPYYVPSLLSRAVELFPVSDVAKWVMGDLWGGGDGGALKTFGEVAKAQLTSTIRRYVKRQLQLAS